MAGLIQATARDYYASQQDFAGDGSTVNFTVALSPQPTTEAEFHVFLDNVEQLETAYSYSGSTLNMATAPALGVVITVKLIASSHGDYRYIPLADIVTNFMFAYVGEGKVLNRANKQDVLFHAKRAIQQFSYDISQVEKIQEVELGPSLSIPMPQDFVGVADGGVSYVDSAGIEHNIPRGYISSNPSQAILQDDEFNYVYDDQDDVVTTEPVTTERWKNSNIGNVSGEFEGYEYDNHLNHGELNDRFGGTPELMNSNGMYFLDVANGKISFSGNLSGLLITIKYVSDGLGTPEEMKVHKFAEQAIYSWISHALVSTYTGYQEYVINRERKIRRAEMHNAKIRLGNFKPKDLMQVMRNKSKQIKH